MAESHSFRFEVVPTTIVKPDVHDRYDDNDVTERKTLLPIYSGMVTLRSDADVQLFLQEQTSRSMEVWRTKYSSEIWDCLEFKYLLAGGGQQPQEVVIDTLDRNPPSKPSR